MLNELLLSNTIEPGTGKTYGASCTGAGTAGSTSAGTRGRAFTARHFVDWFGGGDWFWEKWFVVFGCVGSICLIDSDCSGERREPMEGSEGLFIPSLGTPTSYTSTTHPIDGLVWSGFVDTSTSGQLIIFAGFVMHQLRPHCIDHEGCATI